MSWPPVSGLQRSGPKPPQQLQRHGTLIRATGTVSILQFDNRLSFPCIVIAGPGRIVVPAVLAPRPSVAGLLPEARTAAKAYEKAYADARSKLPAEFDTAVDRLAAEVLERGEAGDDQRPQGRTEALREQGAGPLV